MIDEPPDISFVVPYRNEEAFLAATLESLLAQDLGPLRAEVLLMDGRSTDGSRALVERYARERSTEHVRILACDNPHVTAPGAFNLGIRASRAPIIGLGGAHCLYPPSYLRRAVEIMRSVDAGVVGGGHDRFVPSTGGVLAEAMACLYLSPMGAGVAPYHRRKEPGFVDTVFGGFYRREVFDRVGGFDEGLAKNQDNELNARVTAAGYKVYFHPDLSTAYVLKTDLVAFFKRALASGSYHPTTWLVNPGAFTPRHAVPAAFVLYLAALGGLAATKHAPRVAFAPAAVYAVLIAGAAAKLGVQKRSLGVGLTVGPLFVAYHLAYGAATLWGVVPALRRPGARRAGRAAPETGGR